MKNQEIIIEKTGTLLKAGNCCAELKTAAQDWLDALGTDREKEAGRQYVAALEESVTGIDDCIAFFKTDTAKQKLGDAPAAQLLTHMQEIKQNGAEWCDCPACTAGLAVLAHKEDLFSD